MAAKRSRDVAGLDEIGDEPISSANVHVVVTALSPLKQGRKSVYFDGVVSDGSTSRRVVAFSEKQLKTLKGFKESKMPAELQDCQVKHGVHGEEMEIVIKKGSKIRPSEKKIDTSKIDFDGEVSPLVCVNEVDDKKVFSLVSVRVKVHCISKPETLQSGLTKQDMVIADRSGSGRATIWGENIGLVQTGKSYLLSSFMVKEFTGQKYLSMRKGVSGIEKIDDLQDVAEANDSLEDNVLKNAMIVGVSEFVRKKVCRKCHSYVEPGVGNPPIEGRCMNLDCGLVLRYDICGSRFSAKLMFSAEDSIEVTLTAPGNILRELVGAATDDNVQQVELLSVATLHSVSYNSEGVMTGFDVEEALSPLSQDLFGTPVDRL